MQEPFLIICNLSTELIVDLREKLIPDALSHFQNEISADNKWKKAVNSYQLDQNWKLNRYIFTSFAPADINVGHRFSSIFKRKSRSNKEIHARIKHIVWYIVPFLIPTHLAGHGHRHIFIFDKNDIGPEDISNLPLLRKWEQLGNISPAWYML